MEIKKGGNEVLQQEIANAAKTAGPYAKIVVIFHGPHQSFPNGSFMDLNDFKAATEKSAGGKKTMIVACGENLGKSERFYIDPDLNGSVQKFPRCKAELRLFGAPKVVGEVKPDEEIPDDRKEQIHFEEKE